MLLVYTQELLTDTIMYAAAMEGMQRIKGLELRVESDLTSDQLVNSMVLAPPVCMSISFKMAMWK